MFVLLFSYYDFKLDFNSYFYTNLSIHLFILFYLFYSQVGQNIPVLGENSFCVYLKIVNAWDKK